MAMDTKKKLTMTEAVVDEGYRIMMASKKRAADPVQDGMSLKGGRNVLGGINTDIRVRFAARALLKDVGV